MKKINLNRNRLNEGYDLDHIFREPTYDWPGDTEGRALLAFVSHYKISKEKIKWMDLELSHLKEKMNESGYFGLLEDINKIDEQQLAGHSWLLRGLLEYHLCFNDNYTLQLASNIIEKLFLPIFPFVKNYPLKRKIDENGGVGGSLTTIQDGWELSTDIGCLFISIDGLSQYYEVVKDKRVLELLDELITIYSKIDFVGLRVQTHATLTALRGILRLYQITSNSSYLDLGKSIFDLYLKQGMTLTYENYNWFNRASTWTEPCAVVDSFIISITFYKLFQSNEYLTLARRIWFNGLQFCLRNNGGAGPNSCVTLQQPILKCMMYEAYFCCTMRYAEGLYWYHANKELFTLDPTKEEIVDDFNRHFIDDALLVLYNNEKVILPFIKLKNEEEILNSEMKVLY